MRILFWTEMFWPHIGGAEVFAARLILALRNRGHELVVVTRRDDPGLPETASFDGIPVCRFPFHSALLDGDMDRLARLWRRVGELKRAFAPDLVHLNSLGPSAVFQLGTAGAHPAHLLLTLHKDLYPSPGGRDSVLERALRAADWITVPSLATAAYVRQVVPGFEPRVSTVYNGVETPPLRPSPLPLAEPRLLCLGRLAPEKGFDLALEAMAALNGRCPGLRFVIAGDGPERPALERQAAALGLGGRIEFAGWVAPEAVPALINTCACVVVPSRSETMSLAAVEAALMARPVIAARVGGLPEVVEHGRTGLLVDPGDSRALAEAIFSLLAWPEAAGRMGRAARVRALEVFGWERCVDAYEGLYHQLAGDNSTGEADPPHGS